MTELSTQTKKYDILYETEGVASRGSLRS